MFNLLRGLFKPKTNLAHLIEKGALIVDVRTKAEFQEGHIAHSRNIPLDNLTRELISLKDLKKPLITVCRSGNRSAIARSVLTAAGIESYNGGAWKTLKETLQR